MIDRARATRLRAAQEAQQVARRLRARQRLLGQAHAEGLLEAQQQFDAPEAVETEIALQRAVELGVARAAGLILGEQAVDLGQQPLGRAFEFARTFLCLHVADSQIQAERA